MIYQSNGKIYLSGLRGLTLEGNDYQSYHTFNFGAYYQEHKGSIGNLLFFNDDTLNINAHIKTKVMQRTSLLLLPIVGGLEYKGNCAGFIEAGQFCLLKANTTTKVEIFNPYKTEWINFLQIGINVDLDQIHCGIGEFDLESNPDQLIPLLISEAESPKYFLGSIGKFGGREAGSYTVGNPAEGVFAFVIDGVFEVQDRLLQSRDGLALWDTKEVEFEALSRKAIILFLEMNSMLEVMPTPI